MRYIIALSLIHVLLAANPMAATSSAPQEVHADLVSEDIFYLLDLFGSSLAIIEADYVDDVNVTNLLYGALHGMLRALDPYSQFLEPKAVEQLNISTRGAFGGIGIEIGIQNNMLTVIAPIEDTPAFDAGMLPKDTIIRINDEDTTDMSIDQAIERLRGEPGTAVTVTVRRVQNSLREVKEFPLTRAIIELRNVADATILDPTNGIAYVRLRAFDSRVAATLRDTLDSLATQGMSSLILDLRNNGGGLLTAAIDVSSLFLPPGTPVVELRGRIPSQNTMFNAHTNEMHYTQPLVILVNGNSASAAEIVAGALHDNDRALLIGSSTFGKGSVQSVVPLGRDDAALRLTTARYYTPAGTSIHEKGISPLMKVEVSQEDEIRLIRQRSRAHRQTDPEDLTDKERAQYDEIENTIDVPLAYARAALTAQRFWQLNTSPNSRETTHE